MSCIFVHILLYRGYFLFLRVNKCFNKKYFKIYLVRIDNFSTFALQFF